MKLLRVKRFVLASASFAFPASLSAQAFGLNEIGSCAVGRGFAATAAPCRDASMIFWNSAAAIQLTGWSVTAGVAAVSLKGSFRQDTTFRTFDSDAPIEYPPHFFVNYRPKTGNAAYGLGVYVPYGLTSEWTGDFPGRFVSQRASLKTIYIQPNIAWRLNSKWSVGGGPVFGVSSVELVQAIDLSEQPTGTPNVSFANLGIARGTEFASAKLEGSTNAFGAQIAVAFKPTKDWHVGLRYLTPLEFKYDDADAVFTQVNTGLVVGGQLAPPFNVGARIDTITAIRSQFTNGRLVPQGVSTKITHPAQVQAGVAYSGYKNWLLETDIAWIGWKQFNTLPVVFSGPAPDRVLIEDYNNSIVLRIGAEYTVPRENWKLRAGFADAQSAAPAETVTPLLPEQDRWYWTFGAAVPFGKMWELETGYAHVATKGARGRIVERTHRDQTAEQLNSGVFTLSANVFSFTIKASF